MFYSLELGVVAYTCDPVLRKGRQENQKSRDIFELWQVQDLQQETLSQKTGEQKRFAFISKSICFLSANTSGVFGFGSTSLTCGGFPSIHPGCVGTVPANHEPVRRDVLCRFQRRSMHFGHRAPTPQHSRIYPQ